MEGLIAMFRRGLGSMTNDHVLLRAPLRIEKDGARWSAESAVVSSVGALVLAPIDWADGCELRIENVETGQTARFRVVWSGGEDLPGRFKLGLELLDERPSFWGPRFSMSDARPNAG
jgi:hypothetical protein